MDKKYSAGVIIARFQVDELHKGHLSVINKAISECQQVLIFLGVSVVRDSKKNPLDFITRKMMIEETFPYATNITVCPLPDMPGKDERWSKELDRRIGELTLSSNIAMYASRDSFSSHYKGRHLIIDVSVVDESESGTDRRIDIANTPLPGARFRAGIIYGKMNQYAKVHPTVDIIVYRQVLGVTEILLGRKPDERAWRCLGGFVDPLFDFSLEDAAQREFGEETNNSVDIDRPVYVGSCKVDDERYRDESNKIVTALFKAQYVAGHAKSGDDIAEVQWFTLHEMQKKDANLNPIHRPLIEMLAENVKNN